MNEAQSAAYVTAQAVAAHLEGLGMAAENSAALAAGKGIPYPVDAFKALIDKYGIHHNAILGLFLSPY